MQPIAYYQIVLPTYELCVDTNLGAAWIDSREFVYCVTSIPSWINQLEKKRRPGTFPKSIHRLLQAAISPRLNGTKPALVLASCIY
jgi:hypothetical protein